METYEDFVQFARDCLRHARSATREDVAEKLQLLARQYQARAAKLRNGEIPSLEG